MWWNRTSPCEYDGKSIETEKTKWSEFPNGGKAIVEQILTSKKERTGKSKTKDLEIYLAKAFRILFHNQCLKY